MSNLKQEAIQKGLCKPYQSEWNNDDDLVDRYIKGVTWCMEHQYPSLSDMIPFDAELVDNNVYNAKVVNLILDVDTYILNDCTGIVEIVDYNVSRVYASLNTVLEIKARGNSILFLDCYDNCNARISVSDRAKVYVAQYGNSVVQILSGSATIKDRR